MCDKVGPELTATEITERFKTKNNPYQSLPGDKLLEEMVDKYLALLHRAKLIEQKVEDEK